MITLHELSYDDARRLAADARKAGGFLSSHGADGRAAIVRRFDGAEVELRNAALIEFLYAVKDLLQSQVYEVRDRLTEHGVPFGELSDADRIDLLVARTRRDA